MKKLLYLITILFLLCTSCKTKKVVQEYSMQSDTTRTESRTTKEIAMEKKMLIKSDNNCRFDELNYDRGRIFFQIRFYG